MAQPGRAAPAGGGDRRQRKSRAALRQALLALVSERPFNAITVEEIAEAADVARATFYAHYPDKQTLLAELCREMLDELRDRVAEALPTGATYSGAGVRAILQHVTENRATYELAWTGGGGTTLRAEFVAGLKEILETTLGRAAGRRGRRPRVPLSLVTSSATGSLLLMIESWFSGEYEAEADQLAEWFIRIQLQGLGWALGFEEGDLVFVPGNRPG